MQPESEAIGTDTIGLTHQEIILYRETLRGIIEKATDPMAVIEAKYLLDLIRRKLA
jgi:hypothetical protein